jgi:hypothetical protein
MHPEIHASKPGKCPKCGMDLVKEKAKPTKKSHCAKTSQKLLRKQEQLRQMVLRSRKKLKICIKS